MDDCQITINAMKQTSLNLDLTKLWQEVCTLYRVEMNCPGQISVQNNNLKYGVTHLMSGRDGIARTQTCGECVALYEAGSSAFYRWSSSHPQPLQQDDHDVTQLPIGQGNVLWDGNEDGNADDNSNGSSNGSDNGPVQLGLDLA